MNAQPAPGATGMSRRTGWAAGALLVIATLAAYYNTFAVPFVFDDDEAIVNNPAIRRLWPLDEVLLGGQDAGMTGSGRPVLNLTLALNHAAGGDNVWGYHAVNLLIHVGAGLLLFGLVRRTLRQPELAGRWAATGDAVAFGTALLWLVHPLQTESVTYVVQRAESLAGFFQLLTLYLFVRGCATARPGGWQAGSVAACLLGMGTKEVMVTAPLLVLLYDRTFVAASWRTAWRARRIYYGALAATWLPLLWLVVRTGGRGDSAGFHTAVPAGQYLFTQAAAVVHYLRLVVWPHPLVLDYGTALAGGLVDVWWQGLLLTGLAVAACLALMRRSAWGFVGVCFFVLLAPSSSLVPVASQTMAEHRMYLALVAPLVLAVAGLHARLGWRCRWIVAAAALGCLVLTVRRNEVYESRLALWSDTVAQRPDNARAQNNLAIELSSAGRPEEAVAHFQEALRLDPERGDARNNLANELLRQGRVDEAIAQYERALQTKSVDLLALGNLGVALMQAGRLPEAMARYEQVLAIDPADESAHANLGYILLRLGRPAEALPHYEKAARAQPGDARAQFNVAVALARNGRRREALTQCEAALRLDPDLADAQQLRAQLRAQFSPGPGGGR